MARLTKHNAKRHEAVVGGQACKFDSMAEHRYAEYLERERKAKRIKSWEHHPDSVAIRPRDFEGNDKVLCRVNPDFLVSYKCPPSVAASFEYHEVKGLATAAWRLKRKAMELYTPYVYIVIDAGRGVCATGKGDPALFDERPRKKRKRKC